MTRGHRLDITIPEKFNMTTYILEDNLAKGRGDHIAVYYRDETYTFNELCNLTNRMGKILKQCDVGLEDRVLLILQDCSSSCWTLPHPPGLVCTPPGLFSRLQESQLRF